MKAPLYHIPIKDPDSLNKTPLGVFKAQRLQVGDDPVISPGDLMEVGIRCDEWLERRGLNNLKFNMWNPHGLSRQSSFAED